MAPDLRLVRDLTQSVAQERVRVMLSEDDPAMRVRLRAVLDSAREFDVVAEAGNLDQTQRQLERTKPGVLVLDLHLSDGSSIEAIAFIRRRAGAPEIVGVTMQESLAFANQALDAGALGFVVKDRADTELVEAVRRAARGESYVSPGVLTASQL